MNLLEDYSKKQYKQVLYQLNNYVLTGDAEAMHQMRVALKKIRSVMKFFEVSTHHRKLKKLKKKLRILFSSGGAIRDLQVIACWLKENHFPELLKHSKSLLQLPALHQLFVEQYGSYQSIINAVNAALTVQAKSDKPVSIEKYAFLLRENIETAVPGIEPEQWHDLRKKIKQLLYCYHWLTPGKQLKLMHVAIYKYYDALQEAIGNWHDAIHIKNWLETETFFLSNSAAVRKQYNLCNRYCKNTLAVKAKTVEQLLKKFV